MNLVCFDTNGVIWGVKKQATVGQEENIEKARFLIEKCEREGIKIMVPSVVIAEFLCREEIQSYNKLVELMNRSFIIPPFDTQAAVHFATLRRNRKQLGVDEDKVERKEMIADLMIIAIALARKADCIYSGDKNLAKFAKGYIDVKALPIIEPPAIEDTTVPF